MANADSVSLRSGTTLHGQILSESELSLRLQTESGALELKRADITSIEKGPPPWELYERARADYPETADGHYRLGIWCRDHGLGGKARTHFRRSVELDPAFEPALKALGRRSGDGASTRGSPASQSSSRAARGGRSAESRPGEDDRLAREVMTRWHIRVTDIFKGRLDRAEPDSPRFRDGRSQILAIRDSLAVGSLARVLSRGGTAVRLLMVEALGGFNDDEATLNLVIVALLDPDPSGRTAAATTLRPRKDARIVKRLTDALASDEDMVMRNAAAALGVLRAREAVPDLAKVLYSVERRLVRFKRAEVVGAVLNTFNGAVVFAADGRSGAYRPQIVSVLGSGAIVGTTWVDEVQDVKQYRTDVQEALIAITGENFGFDGDAWMKWAREHPGDE